MPRRNPDAPPPLTAPATQAKPARKRGPAAPVVVDHRTRVGQHRSATMRRRILVAAAQVFSAKGIDAPVIDDFVRAAGISRGTFYNHFTTTAALLEATVEWLREDMNEAIVRVVVDLSDPVRQAATAMRLYLRWATSNPLLCGCVGRLPQISASALGQARKEIAQGMASGEFVLPSVDVGCDLGFGTLAEAIRRAARQPAFDCDEVVAVILTGMGVRRERLAEVMALPLPAVPHKTVLGAVPVNGLNGR